MPVSVIRFGQDAMVDVDEREHDEHAANTSRTTSSGPGSKNSAVQREHDARSAPRSRDSAPTPGPQKAQRPRSTSQLTTGTL